MTSPLFRAHFQGVHIKIIERKSNPCKKPELQHHYFAGYKLVVISVDTELPIPPRNRHFWTKLVYVRPSWNLAIKDASRDRGSDSFITIERDEVISDIAHQTGQSNGMAGEIITFTFHSTIDSFERTASVIIPHSAYMKLATPS